MVRLLIFMRRDVRNNPMIISGKLNRFSYVTYCMGITTFHKGVIPSYC